MLSIYAGLLDSSAVNITPLGHSLVEEGPQILEMPQALPTQMAKAGSLYGSSSLCRIIYPYDMCYNTQNQPGNKA
jgi:hypothetical protein